MNNILQHRGKTLEVYIDEQKLQNRIKELGTELQEEYRDKNPIVLGVLNGALMFMCDLIRNMKIDLAIDLTKLSSYEGQNSTNEVKCLMGLKQDLKGRHVILVDDILETGQTLQKMKEIINQHEVASLKICVLVDKKGKLKVPLKADYVGFEIEDLFIIGYGMDWDEWGRNLNQIYIAK